MAQKRGGGSCCKQEKFLRKPSVSNYKWCTENRLVKSNAPDSGFIGGHAVKKHGCYATAYSVKGEDYETTYVYNKEIIDAIEIRYAYVACGYVE